MSLQSSVSGLQRLFSTVSSTLSPHTPRGQRQLESVTEEAHTHDLLYPECETLQQDQHQVYPFKHGDPSSIAAAANSSDNRGGLDLQNVRDVRIIIAQDANALSPQSRVLFDSMPPISSPTARNSSFQSPAGKADDQKEQASTEELHRNGYVQKPLTAPHSRQASFSQTAQSIFTPLNSPLSPVNEFGSIFGNSKSRNTATRPATSDGESAQNKIAREAREDTDALLDCMFGATGIPSTSSTKIHVKPPRPTKLENGKPPGSASTELPSTGTFAKKRTPLTRSTTAADLQSLSVNVVREDNERQIPRPDSSSIQFTRLFSVDLKDTNFANQNSGEILLPGQTLPNQSHGAESVKPEKAKQLKTPIYAVSIILQMPNHRQRPLTPSFQRAATHDPTIDPTSYPRINAQPWSSERLHTPNRLLVDSDCEIAHVVDQWYILTRALSALETVARCRISDLLAQIEVPQLPPSTIDPLKSPELRSDAKPKKTKQPTQRTLQLSLGALQHCSTVQKVANTTGERVISAMKTRRVVTGQGRWGIWREEARWVGRWAGGKEQNFFLFNVLTAFLGSHTQWLDSLGPSQYRRRHTRHTNDSHSDTNTLQHRTVIVSPDKMAARRLIFLLSAFLPSTNIKTRPDGQFMEDIGSSNAAYSQSPPSSILRQQSLRKALSRRTRGTHTGPYVASHGRSVSLSASDNFPSDERIIESHNLQQHKRRASDARSVRNAGLPISTNNSTTWRGTATTKAETPDTAAPIAHFSICNVNPSTGTAGETRPDSRESQASESLKRTLSRSGSIEHPNASADSHSLSRWGSAKSGFWSDRRGSSTENSDLLASSEEGLGISGVPRDVHGLSSPDKLSQMVDEVGIVSKARLQPGNNHPARSILKHSSGLPHTSQETVTPSPPKVVSIPEETTPERFPIKLSVAHDGIVDVDLPPLKSYSSSFASNMNSPKPVETISSLNSQSLWGSQTLVNEPRNNSSAHPVDVVGWLDKFHQDYALQAVKPYENLKDDIKRSMRAEPMGSFANTPADESAPGNGWTDVCTTLLADTKNFTVTRLCLRRKCSKSPHHQANALLQDDADHSSADEEMFEEPIMDMDQTFVEAVERVLAESGQSSRAASQAASRAPSPSRTKSSTVGEDVPELEVPRGQCKALVLGALEQVARSVSAELGKSRDGKKTEQQGRRERENVPTDSTLREGVRKWLNEVGRDGV